MAEETNGLVDMTKIASLGAKRAQEARDNRLWTPVECLEDAIRDLKSGQTKANKVVVLFVDMSEGEFTVSHYSANIKASEILAAGVVLQAKLLDDMGYG